MLKLTMHFPTRLSTNLLKDLKSHKDQLKFEIFILLQTRLNIVSLPQVFFFL